MFDLPMVHLRIVNLREAPRFMLESPWLENEIDMVLWFIISTRVYCLREVANPMDMTEGLCFLDHVTILTAQSIGLLLACTM